MFHNSNKRSLVFICIFRRDSVGVMTMRSSHENILVLKWSCLGHWRVGSTSGRWIRGHHLWEGKIKMFILHSYLYIPFSTVF